MSDLHHERPPGAFFHAGEHHESRALVTVATAAIIVAFVLSIAVAATSITHGLKIAVDALLLSSPPAATDTNTTTGSAHRS